MPLGAHGDGLSLGYYKGPAGSTRLARVLLQGTKRSTSLGAADDGENGSGLSYSAAVKAALHEITKLQAEMGRLTKLDMDGVRSSYLADLKQLGGNVWDAEDRWAHIPKEW